MARPLSRRLLSGAVILATLSALLFASPAEAHTYCNPGYFNKCSSTALPSRVRSGKSVKITIKYVPKFTGKSTSRVYNSTLGAYASSCVTHQDTANVTQSVSLTITAPSSERTHTFHTYLVGSTSCPTLGAYNAYFHNTVTVDNTAPETQITDAPPAFTPSPDASFSFEPVGATFQCVLDGQPASACTSPKVYTGLLEGAHLFSVAAIDVAGNVDPTPATHEWTIDSAVPDTSISVGPADPASSPDATFEFLATEEASFRCGVDGAAIADCASPFAVGGLSDGPHTFEVTAIDRAGNEDPTPATFAWTIDTAAPDTTITKGPREFIPTLQATFEFESSESPSTFECAITPAGEQPAEADYKDGCTSPYTDDVKLPGRYTFWVRATDEAGNTDPTPDQHTWGVDTTDPVPRWLRPVAGHTYVEDEDVAADPQTCLLDPSGPDPSCSSATVIGSMRLDIETPPPGLSGMTVDVFEVFAGGPGDGRHIGAATYNAVRGVWELPYEPTKSGTFDLTAIARTGAGTSRSARVRVFAVPRCCVS